MAWHHLVAHRHVAKSPVRKGARPPPRSDGSNLPTFEAKDVAYVASDAIGRLSGVPEVPDTWGPKAVGRISPFHHPPGCHFKWAQKHYLLQKWISKKELSMNGEGLLSFCPSMNSEICCLVIESSGCHRGCITNLAPVVLDAIGQNSHLAAFWKAFQNTTINQ